MMEWFAAILTLPYFFLLLKIYRDLLKIITFKASSDPVTFVSVIVACRNEQENLPVLLNSIGLQDYPKELFEVIIVDDNSSDRTFEIASSFEGSYKLTPIYNKGIGKKQAIRSGIVVSSGSLILTTDADCLMGKSWIRTIAAFYEKHKPEMIICPVQIEHGSGFFRKFQELEFISLQGITAGSSFSGKGVMCNGANLSYTREAYFNNSDNLHDEIASGDDVFLLYSLKKNKHSKIMWLESADAMIITAPSSTAGSFLKQRSRWISKSKAYNDKFTLLLGIVTFVTIILQISVLLEVVVNQVYIWVFILIFLIKSIPDFLILHNTSVRYGCKDLLKWFLPAQFVYPFYVMVVFFYSLFNLKINSPFPKEI
jgi:biofilm PGA synthesis N-glycosyltransferase PgaC